MSILSTLFGGGRSPAGAAQPYLDQVPQVGHNYYDPYITQGSTAGQTAQRQYDTMTNDPTGFMNKLMESYEPSKGYQFQKDALMKEMGNTAAAGGVAGTPMDQMNQAQGVQGLLSQDMQQFLSNALGVHSQGLQGEEGVSARGYDASKGLTDILGNNLTNQAGLAFQGQSQQNANQQQLMQMFAQLLGGVGGVATQPKMSLFGKTLWG